MAYLEDYPEILNLLDDDSVLEIFIDGAEKVYVERDRSGDFEDVPSPFRDNDHVMEFVQALVTPLGRVADESNPIVDLRLFDGSRVHIIIPPIAVNGPSVNIRKFPPNPIQANELVKFGAITQELLDFILACVKGRLNIVISGGTGSGKTSLMRVLAQTIGEDERIIVIQQADELRLPQKYTVVLETRPPNIEGRGAITLTDLVISALKMRPDRILTTDVHGDEALHLLAAMNTGHDGSMFSIHGNSPRDSLARLEVMASSANPTMALTQVTELIASAVDLIVHIDRLKDGRRKVSKVVEVVGSQGGIINLQDIFEFRQTGIEDGIIQGQFTATGQIPRFLNRLRDAGIDLDIQKLFTPV